MHATRPKPCSEMDAGAAAPEAVAPLLRCTCPYQEGGGQSATVIHATRHKNMHWMDGGAAAPEAAAPPPPPAPARTRQEGLNHNENVMRQKHARDGRIRVSKAAAPLLRLHLLAPGGRSMPIERQHRCNQMQCNQKTRIKMDALKRQQFAAAPLAPARTRKEG